MGSFKRAAQQAKSAPSFHAFLSLLGTDHKILKGMGRENALEKRSIRSQDSRQIRVASVVGRAMRPYSRTDCSGVLLFRNGARWLRPDASAGKRAQLGEAAAGARCKSAFQESLGKGTRNPPKCSSGCKSVAAKGCLTFATSGPLP